MTETTQEERDQLRRRAGNGSGDGCGAKQTVSLLNDADRLAAIERQVIYRTGNIPECAIAWLKRPVPWGCEWVTYESLAEKEIFGCDRDFRPDHEGPIILPIIDAPDSKM